MKTAEKTLVSKLSKNPKQVLATLTEDDIANVLQLANYHYYNSDKPLFLDNVYDMIKEHLEEKNPFHPILKHIGAIVDKNDARKIKLPYFMGSMDKIKSDGTVINKWRSNYAGNVVISDKLDGNSGMLYFKDGELKMFTRGNGEEGQNITHLIPFVQNIPGIDKFPKKYDEITVRGELIISKADFQKVKDLGANARNMVAGLLNAKIPNLEIAKYTQFVSYEVIHPRLTPSVQFEQLRKWGFKPAVSSIIKTDDVNADTLSKILIERRNSSEFEIDGIIVCHDAIHNRKDGENPKHAFAFKSVAMMDRAEVIVNSVEWNLSKDGFLKPTILFDPVQLSGASVRRATGFNGKFIQENKIGPGAKLVVMRSGDVIPHVIEITEKAEASMPDVRYTWTETGIDIIANTSNSKTELELRNLVFFFGKVKVNGVSEGILTKLHKAGYDTVGKILNITKQQLLDVEGFQEKSVEKVISALNERFKQVEPVLLAAASNRFGRGMGERKLQSIVNMYPELLTNKSYKPSVSDLVAIEGIEKKTAELVIKNIPEFWKFVEDNELQKFFIKTQIKKEVPVQNQQIFAGQGFIFTGVRSKPAEDFIKNSGGELKTSMSKKVNYLICKDTSVQSSKMKEARENGVQIISLKDFMEKYNISG
jgi:DNA ligase (NAD+)